MRTIHYFFAAAALATIAGAAQAEEWATLKGHFVVDGKVAEAKSVDRSKDAKCTVDLKEEKVVVDDKGNLANAVVMLRTKNVPVHPSYASTADATIDLDNKNCRFEPHVEVVRVSQTLALKNSDPTGHNSNLTPLNSPQINPVLAVGADPIKYKFNEEEAVPVKVGCNIHPWMGAYIVVRKDPYAAVSGKDGKFEIKDLPAGKDLEFTFWQETPGYLKGVAYKGGKADTKGRFKIKLKPGENDLGDIKVPASLFK